MWNEYVLVKRDDTRKTMKKINIRSRQYPWVLNENRVVRARVGCPIGLSIACAPALIDKCTGFVQFCDVTRRAPRQSEHRRRWSRGAEVARSVQHTRCLSSSTQARPYLLSSFWRFCHWHSAGSRSRCRESIRGKCTSALSKTVRLLRQATTTTICR